MLRVEWGVSMSAMLLGGRYQVQDRIGTGGMATVYRGLDEVLGRTVAIKTMLPQYANDPSFAARFKQEAQAAAALQSPYIVSVYDWGKDADTYYIVMEYLRGTDLKSGIRKHGALDCKKVAQIGSQIAQALSVAHKHDIIHRDIKPQNIMVQPDGNIKVMDFGIARAKNSHLTQDNSVLGTAHYVSPEQTQGKELGPTTDIYSLGIVMYEAATGQVPFQGDDAISVALKQVNEQPKPPSQLNPAVDDIDTGNHTVVLPGDSFTVTLPEGMTISDQMADNDKPIQIGQLPTKAQTFISTYFKNAKIALAKQETELFDKSYDVIFTNGEKLEFDKSGDWTEVSCKINGVPAAIIPQAIRTYVETNYPDAKVLKIERDRHEYEVKLSNRWEITFDNQMRVIDIDD